MGLPLYVAKSPSSERDVKTKSSDKIPGPRRSIRRRARLNDLSHNSERDRLRQRQRAAFIATHVNDRNSDEDRGPSRDRQMTVERIDLGPIRSRLERSGRSQGPYFASILDNVHSETSDLRDWGRPQDDDPPDYFISDPMDRTVPIDSLGHPREHEDSGPGRWRSADIAFGNPTSRDRMSTISPWELYLDGGSRHDEHRAGPIDGLGDRERSLSPDTNGTWDTLLTTLTPDPQPPSAGSSFASVTASTATSQSTSQSTAPSVPSTQRQQRTGESAVHHECGVCDRCLRRRANLAAMRSRGPPLPPLPLNDMPPFVLPGRRTHRNRYGAIEANRRASERLRAMSRFQPPDYLSPTSPDDENSLDDEDAPFDVWTRRQREVSRRG